LIDVAFTGKGLRPADAIVVLDVLRATSTVTQALAVGYRQVVCVESIERAAAWRGPGRVLAGERHCVRPAGFDLGNSPRELTGDRGELLVLATTNGAPTIVAAARYARTVLLACVLNLEAVAGALRGSDGLHHRDVQIVCSGTGGSVAVEDAYLAGRLCAELNGRRTDAARVAEAVARTYPTPLQALAASAGATALRAAGLGEDIAYCARESTLGVVPRLAGTSAGAAIIVEAGQAEQDGGLPALVDDRDTVGAR
jgi:2-phosphosulfolactate phosphatase